MTKSETNFARASLKQNISPEFFAQQLYFKGINGSRFNPGSDLSRKHHRQTLQNMGFADMHSKANKDKSLNLNSFRKHMKLRT